MGHQERMKNIHTVDTAEMVKIKVHVGSNRKNQKNKSQREDVIVVDGAQTVARGPWTS